MNFLDKTIGWFSPSRGATRARARAAMRAYEGAQVGRRGSSWRATGSSQNTELGGSLKPLRDRARELGRNNPIAARILDILPAHVVGTGIVPVANTGVDKIDRQVNDLWNEWCKRADVTGRQSFYAMQVLAVRSIIESGEVVARFITTEFDEKRNGPVPLKLQLLEADFIDHYRDGVLGGSAYPDTKNARVKRTRLGVALGDYDRWEGLWLWPYHPGEITTLNQVSITSQFVAQDDLLHVFKMIRPGQVRGVSWFAPVLMTARDLADFIDAVNVKARVEACFAGFITNDDSTMPLMDGDTSGLLGVDASLPQAQLTTLEPGMLKELRTGQQISFAQPTSNTQIEPMMLYNLQALAAGVGCTYDQATGDLRQANYSSLRAGKLDFWRLVSQFQQHMLIPMFCQPVWDRFIADAILSGRLKKNKGGYPVDWVVPSREAIDPKKDLDAEKNEVRSGRMTMQEFIASKGGNWRTTLDDFSAFFERADELGLVFDTDVRKVDQHGRQPPSGDPSTDGTAQDATNQASDDAESDGPADNSSED